ncbi:hypothetical protein Cgig2_010551 [Carnegiea gigantea]|uniref:BHLH domain-containing protein n=1 Tax=Carnegiea gigantea TaxID=171969 RepID=A0A9Q1QNT4_9CARY|nr:hypothetical protein Cgig2_010551 [Carnegiea gigantea]
MNPFNSNNRGRGRGRKPSSSNTQDDSEKKIIHREIERQRRQEMSNLYASLRDVLPAEYIKGKRAVSDHVAEAANYIKDLERNVKELGERRDQLRNSIEGGGSSSSFSPESAVSIRQFGGGLEIEINVDCEDMRFSLATALQIAYEEGLCVESYSSTKVSDRFIHNLLCEVKSNYISLNFELISEVLFNFIYRVYVLKLHSIGATRPYTRLCDPFSTFQSVLRNKSSDQKLTIILLVN